jgi:hypothetical protein
VVSVAALFATASHAQVVINEIHYHPGDPADPTDDAEFIELYNAGPTAVDISDWSLDAFTTPFVFPPSTTLPIDGYVVVAKDAAVLLAVTGFSTPHEWPDGMLDNGGERVKLLDDSSPTPALIDEVRYDDDWPWVTEPDGDGPSLELINPDFDNSYASVWRASTGTNGTPGAVNSVFSEAPVVLTETPARGSIVTGLSTVSVTFAEPVTGVVAGDLTVNGAPASTVTGSLAGPYEFSGFAAPAVGPIQVDLAAGSIQDLDTNAFGGDSWYYGPAVVINELHYHPGDHPSDPFHDAEFIELHNAEAVEVNISGWSLDAFATPFIFPQGTNIPAGGYVVVAKDASLLLLVTGFSTLHEWSSGSLRNEGEEVLLSHTLGIQDRVDYSPEPPWPTEPDGSGPSLELIHPSIDNSLPRAWKASTADYGTPGAVNSAYDEGPIVISESPERGAVIAGLTQVSVTFHEPVTGVTAGDLTVNTVPATGVTGSDEGPYVFTWGTPPTGDTFDVVLAAGAIQDLGSNPFLGDTWQYQVNLPKIVINEIHYHPVNAAEELQFLELYNDDTTAIDLSGWAMASDSIGFAFPASTSLASGAYLILAKDVTALLAAVPSIPGGVQKFEWDTGNLANSGERVTLVDAYGNPVDDLTYSDAGLWPTAADGTGPSAELINPVLKNEYGAAWKPSTGAYAVNGSPGQANSVFESNPAPIIFDVSHDPAIPGANEPVTITARVLDDVGLPTVTLFYRVDQVPTDTYSWVSMVDAGDDVYTYTFPAGLADGQRLDFAITASAGEPTPSVAPPGHDCGLPDPPFCDNMNPSQTFLIKFSDDPIPTDFPSYHLITTQFTRNEQNNHNKIEYDATFIQCKMSGAGCDIFYNVIERYRGDSTLIDHPHSFRIEFSEANPLPSEMGFPITRLNLMAQQAARQELGYQMFESLGDPVPKRQFVRLNTNPLSHGATLDQQDWVYLNVERVDSDFFSSQGGLVTPSRFPESGGNAYRGYYEHSAPVNGIAEFQYHGTDPDSYRADTNAGDGYVKVTNAEEDDWNDLIDLTDALTCSTSDGGQYCVEPDESGVYPDLVPQFVDVEQWARWFAMHNVLNNYEGGIYRDFGDDYFVYMWPSGNHATLIPWDMDAIMGVTQQTIWRTTPEKPRLFLRHNAFAGIFVGAICDQLDGVFSQAQMDARIDALPEDDDLWPTGPTPPQGDGPQTKQGIKDWVGLRHTFINAEISRQTTIDPQTVPPVYTDPNPIITITGALNQCHAASVVVNGQPADTFKISNENGGGADWEHDFWLVPGVNNIKVQTLDHDGNEIDNAEATVVYNLDGAGGGTADHLELTVPTRMVNTKTLTLKAEIHDVAGNIYWPTCSELGTVSARRADDLSAVPISITIFEEFPEGTAQGTPPADSIRFYNGVGSVSITLDDPVSVAGDDIEVTVTVGSLTASAVVTVLDVNEPGLFKPLSGILAGADLNWGPVDGVIHLTDDVTVPAGSTLNIAPGTLVMVRAGDLGDGTKILVEHNVSAQGTQAEPIFFFAEDGALAMELPDTQQNNPFSWQGFRHSGSLTSSYSHVFVTGAGNGPQAGHPRAGVFQVAHLSTHELNMTDCVVADSPGKVVVVEYNGSAIIRRNLWSRVGRGGEFLGISDTLVVEDSWFTRVGRAPQVGNLDGDVLSLHGASSTHTISGSVFADCGDDMIDANGANPVINDSIFWDARSKFVSLDVGGSVSLDNVLAFDIPIGIDGGPATVAYSTITSDTPISDPASVDTSIFWSAGIPPGACAGNINHTLAGTSDHLPCGTGNLSADPLFQDPAGCDYSLQAASPAATANPTGGRIGWLGFPDGSACVIGADCDDGNVCTNDACDAGACVFTPRAGCTPCDTHPPDCEDNDPCTQDECVAGECFNWPLDTGSCDDGLDCTNPDVCSGGVCVGANDCPNSGEWCDPGFPGGQCVIPQEVIWFQDDGTYSGTQDTFLAESQPSTPQGTLEHFEWDADEPPASGQEHVGLIRFDGIVGSGLDQIPERSNVVSATLTLTVSDPGAVPEGDIHRSLVDWDQADATWNTFGPAPGVQPADVGVFVENAPITGGTQVIDVASAVQAWVDDPATNLGLIFLPNSSDNLQVRSSESTVAAERPLLMIEAEVWYCENDADCADGTFCNGVETCNTGTNRCDPGTPVDCDDSVDCTVDSCNENTNTCDHTLCSMTASAIGSRYLEVLPPADIPLVALRVDSAMCPSRYVDASGRLTASFFRQSSASWGTVIVGDREVVPGTAYTVHAEVVQGTPIGTDPATTWPWGETNNENDVNVFDILCVLDGVGGIFVNCSLYGVDLMGFVPDALVDSEDVTAVLDGFQLLPYPDNDPCGSPAPPMATDPGAGSVDSAPGEDVDSAPTASALVPFGATWSYLDDGSDQGTDWAAPGYVDDAWATGPAELGFGEGDETTVVGCGCSARPCTNTTCSPKTITTYFRHEFPVDDASEVTGLTLNVVRNAGVVAYLNGTEVCRDGLPIGPVRFNTLASSRVSGRDTATPWVCPRPDPNLLVEGTNVLAVEVHQEAVTSSNLSFDLELTADMRAESQDSPQPISPFARTTNRSGKAVRGRADGYAAVPEYQRERDEGFSVNAEGEISCVLSKTTTSAGSSVKLETFLENLGALPGVRGYQTEIQITRTFGDGSVTVACPDGIQIDDTRPDYLFTGQADVYPVANCGSLRTASSLLSGSVTAGAAEYLSDYTLDVSTDASVGSTFEISFAATPDTSLADANGDPIPVQFAPACVLTVGPCDVADCQDGSICTSDTCENDACAHAPSGDCWVDGTVRYYRSKLPWPDGTEPSSKGVPDVDIDIDTDSVPNATTDVGGYYDVQNLAYTIQVETMDKWDADPVDPDREDAIDSWDASLIARHSVADITLSSNQQIAADVYPSAGVTAFDASWVAQFAVKLVNHFPVANDAGSDWDYLRCDNYSDPSNHDCTTPIYPHDPLTGPETDDFYAVLYGDVDGNWTPPGTSPAESTSYPPISLFGEQRVEEARAAMLDPEIQAWLQPGADRSPRDGAGLEVTGWKAPDGTGAQRRELTLEIREGDGIQAFDMQLHFDPAKVKIVDVRTVDLTADFALLANDLGGEYRIAMYDLIPMRGSGAVLAITVELEPGIGRGFPLDIRAQANEVPIPVHIEGSDPLTRHPENIRRGDR